VWREDALEDLAKMRDRLLLAALVLGGIGLSSGSAVIELTSSGYLLLHVLSVCLCLCAGFAVFFAHRTAGELTREALLHARVLIFCTQT